LIEVSWLEQTSADLPAGEDWLSAGEAQRLAGMRFPKRRDDWRLGRWTAKQAVSVYLNLPGDPGSLARIEIRPAPSGAPDVFLENAPAPVVVSISHRAGVAACAVAAPEVALGCDLEIVEQRSDAFATDYFTGGEQELLARASPADRVQLLALLWSGKESVLKALRVGLRMDTRCVAVDPCMGPASGGGDWRPLCARHNGEVLNGWWRQTGSLVRTLVAVPAPEAPQFRAG
jgi:4'-phosphopantetheinyl transferase